MQNPKKRANQRETMNNYNPTVLSVSIKFGGIIARLTCMLTLICSEVKLDGRFELQAKLHPEPRNL